MNILFLGDSITDCGHCFTRDNLGTGYVKHLSLLVQDMLHPHASRQMDRTGTSGHAPLSSTPLVTNGGTDGFTFPRTFQKWLHSYQDLSWDIVVITGGINEVGYIMDSNQPRKSTCQYLQHSMDALHGMIASILETHCSRIFLVEPFLFPIPEYRRLWFPTLKEIRRQICEKAGNFPSDSVQVLPTQAALDALAREQGTNSVTTDGIHLTEMGNQYLAQLILPYLFP